MGAGAFVGRGSDAMRVGGSAALSGGLRFHNFVAAQALLFYQEISLRSTESERRHGDFVAIALAPRYYPLGGQFRFEPSMAPLLRDSYLSGAVHRSRVVVSFESRAVVVGLTLDAVWTLGRVYAVGLNTTVLELYVKDACIRLHGETASCSANSDGSTRLVSLQLAFKGRYRERARVFRLAEHTPAFASAQLRSALLWRLPSSFVAHAIRWKR